jgi:hypothetical protein
MDVLERAKGTYEGISGRPTSRQEFAAVAPPTIV